MRKIITIVVLVVAVALTGLLIYFAKRPSSKPKDRTPTSEQHPSQPAPGDTIIEAAIGEAIYLDPKTKARVVDEKKCIGCGTCAKNCPWGMIQVNPETKKAVKCDFCGGNPQCVEWCPTDAITIKEA